MLETQRQLAAIMFTDIVGYTALMGESEDKAYQLLKKNRRLQKPMIEKHRGIWLKEMGDGVLASFPTVSAAVYCAIEIQRACKDDTDLKLRIGIHQGEVIVEDGDVFGDGVNIASRLEPLAPVGSIYISESVFRNIENKEGVKAVYVREETLKNVKHPVRIYEVNIEESEWEGFYTDRNQAHNTIAKKSVRTKMVLGLVIFIALFAITSLILDKRFADKNITGKTTVEEIEKSIAVMPFDNESTDEENEYFVSGMIEDIRNNLSIISDLRVISKTSTEKYKGTALTSIEMGKELSVNYLLEGTGQKLGDQVKIHAQLIDTENDDHLWQETYLRDISDIEEVFKIQSEIAQSIANKLNAVITPEENARIISMPTDNSEAYDLYLRASWETRDATSNSVELLEKAIQLDPDFADAYALLGFSKSQFWWFGDSDMTSAEEAFNTGMPYYEKALELDPDNVVALERLISSLILYRWDFEEAEKKRQILFKLNPDANEWGHLLPLGSFKEALELTESRFEIDPFSAGIWQAKILCYYFNNMKNDALLAIETARKGDFENPHLELDITRVYLYLGMYDEALAFLDQFFQNYIGYKDTPRPLGFLAITYYHTKKLDETREILERLQLRSEESSAGSPSFFITMINAQMGEIDLAFKWLEKAYEDHEVEMYWLKVEPLFEPMREDPRWQEMLDKVGFPE